MDAAVAVTALQGGALANVSERFDFNSDPDRPKIDTWLRLMFPAPPPDGNWANLVGNPPVHFLLTKDPPAVLDRGLVAELGSKYTYEQIRRAYILSKQCIVRRELGAAAFEDSRLKALADNYLMDAYVHWNFSAYDIGRIMNNRALEPNATRDANLRRAQDAGEPLCQALPGGQTEIEQNIELKAQLQDTESSNLGAQERIASLEAQLQAQAQEILRLQAVLESAEAQAAQAVAAVRAEGEARLQSLEVQIGAQVAESTLALQESNRALDAELEAMRAQLADAQRAHGAQLQQLQATFERVQRERDHEAERTVAMLKKTFEETLSRERAEGVRRTRDAQIKCESENKAQLTAELAKARGEFTDFRARANEELSRAKDDFDAAIRASIQKVRTAETSVADLRRQLDAAALRNSELEAKVLVSSKAVEDALAELQRRAIRITTMETTQRAAKESWETKFSELQNRLEQAQERVSGMERLEVDLGTLKSAVETERGRVDAERRRAEALRVELEAMRARVSRAEEAYPMLEAARAEIMNERLRTESERRRAEAARAEGDAARTRVTALEELGPLLESARNEIQAERARGETERRRAEALRVELESARTKLGNVERTMEGLQGLITYRGRHEPDLRARAQASGYNMWGMFQRLGGAPQ